MDMGVAGGQAAMDEVMTRAEITVLWAEAERLSGRQTGKPGGGADKNVRPTQTRQPKRLGEIAEAEFLAKAERLRFGVACPWGDSERYDFIVDAGGRLWRVQVKSAHRAGQDGCYSFRAHTSSLEAYRPSEIDVLAAYVVPEDVWYVFPVKELRGVRSLKIFSGSRRKRSKFEKFREAWWILEMRKPECSGRK